MHSVTDHKANQQNPQVELLSANVDLWFYTMGSKNR